jgi:hypothetical protein
MQKYYNISGNYTNDEKKILEDLITTFRLRTSDDDPEKNVLGGKVQQYSDNKIVQLLFTANKDINSGFPRTKYTLFEFYNKVDDDLLVNGAIVWALIGEGLLQLRNQIDYSDSGLTVAMFNKTALFQGWAGFFLQQYLIDKKEFKSTVIPGSSNSGFVGIGSEFGYDI